MEIVFLILNIYPVMLLHELGHLGAARACGVQATELSLGIGPNLFERSLGGVTYRLRAFPLVSFVRLRSEGLMSKPASQQLMIHLGGVAANLAAAALAYGTSFGWLNLLLGLGNLLPLYQQDGWKCGLVLVRSLLRRRSRPVEWAYTLSGGVVSVVLVRLILHTFL